ncbi:fasciclin-like arabinogalactan protein 3 [Salvia splendens]|uniref:fasciclin-like arabinogalactan protein 3 n=1 Tax=Salvia splendens TaxID=180675 RepID=UPI001C2561C1|nr:fasciclin-like arabinogalactan protein 3 [Salvia splendens]
MEMGSGDGIILSWLLRGVGSWQVNSRRTITVLGLPNDRIGTLMQLPEDVQKSILTLHVILDYFDMSKLTPANKTTLYQSSGVANGQQGFIDVVRRRDGTIVFGSPLVCNFVNPVAAQPFNISQPIIAPGMDGTYVETPATPPPPAAEDEDSASGESGGEGTCGGDGGSVAGA